MAVSKELGSCVDSIIVLMEKDENRILTEESLKKIFTDLITFLKCEPDELNEFFEVYFNKTRKQSKEAFLGIVQSIEWLLNKVEVIDTAGTVESYVWNLLDPELKTGKRIKLIVDFLKSKEIELKKLHDYLKKLKKKYKEHDLMEKYEESLSKKQLFQNFKIILTPLIKELGNPEGFEEEVEKQGGLIIKPSSYNNKISEISASAVKLLTLAMNFTKIYDKIKEAGTNELFKEFIRDVLEPLRTENNIAFEQVMLGNFPHPSYDMKFRKRLLNAFNPRIRESLHDKMRFIENVIQGGTDDLDENILEFVAVFGGVFNIKILSSDSPLREAVISFSRLPSSIFRTKVFKEDGVNSVSNAGNNKENMILLYDTNYLIAQKKNFVLGKNWPSE